MTIASEAQGKSSQWSYDLAEAINTAHQGKLRAGVKGSDGNITPLHGVNQVYVPKDSTVQSVTLTYAESQSDDIVEESLSVANVNATKIANGKATVTFNATASGKMHLTATVNDHAGTQKGSIQQTIDNRSLTVSIPLTNVQAGHHMLRYSASNAQGATLSQGVIDLMLEESTVQPDPTPAPAGNYDYTFPDNALRYPLFSFAKCGLLNDKAASTLYNDPRQSDYIHIFQENSCLKLSRRKMRQQPSARTFRALIWVT